MASCFLRFLRESKTRSTRKSKNKPSLDVSNCKLPDASTPCLLAESLDRFLDCLHIRQPSDCKNHAFRSPESSAVSISFDSLASKSSIAKVHRFAGSLTSAAPILRSSQKTSSRNLRETRKEFPTAFAHSDAVPQAVLSHYIDAGKDALTLPDRQASRSRGELRCRFN